MDKNIETYFWSQFGMKISIKSFMIIIMIRSLVKHDGRSDRYGCLSSNQCCMVSTSGSSLSSSLSSSPCLLPPSAKSLINIIKNKSWSSWHYHLVYHHHRHSQHHQKCDHHAHHYCLHRPNQERTTATSISQMSFFLGVSFLF